MKDKQEAIIAAIAALFPNLETEVSARFPEIVHVTANTFGNVYAYLDSIEKLSRIAESLETWNVPILFNIDSAWKTYGFQVYHVSVTYRIRDIENGNTLFVNAHIYFREEMN